MDLQDRIIMLFLAAFDRLMDGLTLGHWSKWQGEKLVYPWRE